MIQRKRIDNDVFVRWAIFRPDGGLVNLSTVNIVKVSTRAKNGNHYIEVPYDIVSTNILDIQFPAHLQKDVGKYNLYLQYTEEDSSVKGGIATRTLDYCNAFELVPVTCLLLEPQEDPVNIQGIIAAFSYSMLTDTEKSDLAARLSGHDRSILRLRPSTWIVRKNKIGKYIPTTVTITAETSNTNVSVWKIGVGTQPLQEITSSNSPISGVSLTGNTITLIPSKVTFDEFKVYATDGTREDSISISYYEDPKDGEDGIDGTTPDDGQDGEKGDTIRNIMVYKITDDPEGPDTPTDRFVPPNGWSKSIGTFDPSLGERVWFTQITQRNNTLEGNWEVPQPLTGIDGIAGTDGTKYEFIFTRTKELYIEPEWPESIQEDDYEPTGWVDDPVGVDEEDKIEWVSIRSKKEDVWGEYSKPSVWSMWGTRGIDGDSVEYIFCRTKELTPEPERPIDSPPEIDDYVPVGPDGIPWTDEPQGVDPFGLFKYEWVSIRKKKNGLWEDFSPPALWANWAEDGEKGEPGDSEQSIYFRTEIQEAPERPNNNPTDDTHLPTQWTRHPKGVTKVYKYEWVSVRKKVEGLWGNYSEPGLFANFSKNGSDGQQGLQGCVVRNTQWAEGIEYRNDCDLETNDIRYIDIAIIVQPGTGDFEVYKCTKTHDSSIANKPGGSGSWKQYWDYFTQMPPIYTPFIMAENAVLKFTQSNELLVTDENGVVVAGITGKGDIKIWAGGSVPSNANFTVSEDGTVIGNGYKFLSGGSGELAKGNIAWTADGSLDITGLFKTNSNGNRIEINPVSNQITMTNAQDERVVQIYFSNEDGGNNWGRAVFTGYENVGGSKVIRETVVSPSGVSSTIGDYGNHREIKIDLNGINYSVYSNNSRVNRFEMYTNHYPLNNSHILDLFIEGLPTTKPTMSPYKVWNDNGTLKIS